MKQINAINSEIQDYLRGAARAPKFEALSNITDAQWTHLASAVLDKRKAARAIGLLELLSDDALVAIAQQNIQMVDELASAKFKLAA